MYLARALATLSAVEMSSSAHKVSVSKSFDRYVSIPFNSFHLFINTGKGWTSSIPRYVSKCTFSHSPHLLCRLVTEVVDHSWWQVELAIKAPMDLFHWRKHQDLKHLGISWIWTEHVLGYEYMIDTILLYDIIIYLYIVYIISLYYIYIYVCQDLP